VDFMKNCKLSELEQGTRAKVLDINPYRAIGERLRCLGLVKGTEVTCLQKSPLGDPTAFLIRGAVIAIRNEDSSCVQVEV
jgi:ferrous iron transport protein A